VELMKLEFVSSGTSMEGEGTHLEEYLAGEKSAEAWMYEARQEEMDKESTVVNILEERTWS
jgi:hypothetical protein